jgi:hypothetical protein
VTGRGKKGAKRAPRRPKASDEDNELAELASVLAEYSLDNNAGGWFRPAWRNGWNAVELAAKAIDPCAERAWLEAVCAQPHTSAEAYWRASELLYGGGIGRMTGAALRCLQVLIANSDGGGEVYNSILVGPFSEELPEDVFDLVLEYRCRDSIGTTAVLQGDNNDRQRRAFSIAWNRGLYLAAYSLPPAIQDTLGRIVVWKDSPR